MRRAAVEALAHIRDGTPYERKFHSDNFPFEFFAYEHIAEPEDACESIAIPPLPESQARKLRANSDAVSMLKYKKQAEPQEEGRKPRMLSEILTRRCAFPMAG